MQQYNKLQNTSIKKKWIKSPQIKMKKNLFLRLVIRRANK